ncbi:hypothetical protein C8R43DRAFT_955818 [Mycena crocata]|nr:hypothetical protein C8R43DRAFT_955818 [Mycena crocata]
MPPRRAQKGRNPGGATSAKIEQKVLYGTSIAALDLSWSRLRKNRGKKSTCKNRQFDAPPPAEKAEPTSSASNVEDIESLLQTQKQLRNYWGNWRTTGGIDVKPRPTIRLLLLATTVLESCSMAATPNSFCSTFRPSLLAQMTHAAELEKRLRNDDYPSQFENIHCQSIISTSPAEIQPCDYEIYRLRDILNQLEVNRAAIQEYSQLCRSILAPIRRLPSEILVEIFTSFLDALPLDVSSLDREEASLSEEIRRLVKPDLMRLSHVCLRWRHLILGTPRFCSDVALDLRCWSEAQEEPRMLDLLKGHLDRGVDAPLEVGASSPVETFESFDHHRPLNLLAQYSRRWEAAICVMPLDSLEHISAVKGNLPLLNTLQMNGGCFGTASEALSVLPRLSTPENHLELRVYMGPDIEDDDNDDAVSGLGTDALRVTAQHSSLTLGIAGAAELTSANDALFRILSHLSLPTLRQWTLGYPASSVPHPWPHGAFLDLSRRSAFHTHLESLDLCRVVVTEAELVEVLAVLPLLVDLTIWDHKIINDEGVDHVLITDSLLGQLTWSSDAASPACLVPVLGFLGFTTLFQFTDDVYRRFVQSRVKPGRNEEGPFEVEIEWYPGHRRDFDPAVQSHFDDLVAAGELLYSSRLSPAFPVNGS